MRVLILSITAGQGHNATGKAVMSYLKSIDVPCGFVDAYEYVAPILREGVDRGYLFTVAHTPKIFGHMYHMAGKKHTLPLSNTIDPVHFFHRLFATGLRELIVDYEPDVIICTHPFAALIADTLKKRDNLDVINVGIVTDFTIHPYWDDMPELDYFVTGSEYLAYQFMDKGLSLERMLPLGIPIQEKFSQKGDPQAARESLGLAPEMSTILLMGGSMGHGHIDGLIERLDDLPLDFQMVVICGANKQMAEKIKHLQTDKPVHVFGYVNNVDVFMDAADCLIGKPGGLTCSEAIAKELPMIVADAIPGVENLNAEFLGNMGMVINTSSSYSVEEGVYVLLKQSGRRTALLNNLAQFGKKHAAKNLGDFLQAKVAEKKAQA